MAYLVESGFADLIADFHLCQVLDVRFLVNMKIDLKHYNLLLWSQK